MTAQFVNESQATVDSFRLFTPGELASFKALHIRIITAAAGDTEAILARRMHGVDRPRELFRALNDLEPGARIEAGTRLKIVDDR